jgi:thioredoxin 2
MNDKSIIVRCPKCGTKNRVPGNRWDGQPVCAKCKAPLPLSRLYPDSPIDVTDRNFQTEVVQFPGTVLVDFTAPW